MRIVFLVGSLELGKDGVGDYTRMLAEECARLGHKPFLISLNDPGGSTPLRTQSSLRLGSKVSWVDRIQAVRGILAENQPDIVSLQFVPYAFHPAGLPFFLPRILRAAIGTLPVQIMFHEIWIGAEIRSAWKKRVLGFCQRRIILKLVRSLNCRVIHTSNLTYVRLLNGSGVAAMLLPLFGNIPIVSSPTLPPPDDNVLRLVLFGSIHPEWSPDELLARLGTLRKRIQLSHIGRIGPGESSWKEINSRYGSEIEVRRLGEQPADQISRFFASVDFGISTNPLALSGKSGSVAAMLEHGLPVIVSRNDVHFSGIPEVELSSERLIPLDEHFLERVRSLKRGDPRGRLTEVTAQFLGDIGA